MRRLCVVVLSDFFLVSIFTHLEPSILIVDSAVEGFLIASDVVWLKYTDANLVTGVFFGLKVKLHAVNLRPLAKFDIILIECVQFVHFVLALESIT